MMLNSPMDRRAILLVGAVVLVVAGLPWITEIWGSGSLFGFPVSGFLLFLFAPALLILLSGMRLLTDDGIDTDRAE